MHALLRNNATTFRTETDAHQRCPNCAGVGATIFYRIDQIPVHSTLLMNSAQEARAYPRRNLRLGFCAACGFVFNTVFEPDVHEYSTNCEESQAFSPTFNDFARGLARRWVARYGIRNKKIVEIGCGKGDFLMLICEAGDNQGIGIDPSAQPDRIPAEFRERVRFIQELYGPQHADLDADVILCRHTLEHIHDTGAFLANIRRVIGDRKDTLVLFELPDVVRVLDEGAFWDIYYEHCSYFSPGSLARLFAAAGFEVQELERGYSNQYLLIAARPADQPTTLTLPLADDLENVALLVERFQTVGADQINRWSNEMRLRAAAGQRVVLWGALSKAVSFLTTLKLDSDVIEYVVDINPYRHGKFMPGTSQEIVPPQFLGSYRPDCVVAMNPIYTTEIQRDLDRFESRAELLAV